MPYGESFDDLVGIPSPNVRSLFTDTEHVHELTTAQPNDGPSPFCPSCHRVLPETELACPDDGTALVALPPQGARGRQS